MAVVELDVVEGNGGDTDAAGWVAKTGLAHVTRLVRTLGGDDLLESARLAMIDAGFVRGAPHVVIPSLFLSAEQQYKAINSAAVDVGLRWARPSVQTDPNYVKIRLTGSLVVEKTNLDAAGNVISLGWKANADAAERPQAGMVDVGTQTYSVTFSKLLAANPNASIAATLGRRNAGTFQGNEAGYWLMTDGSSESPDGGAHWETSLTFTFNARQWKQTVYYVMDTGRPPDNYAAAYNVGLTVKAIDVVGTANFGVWGLPSAFA